MTTRTEMKRRCGSDCAALGNIDRDLNQTARWVAIEAMRRARRNIEHLILLRRGDISSATNGPGHGLRRMFRRHRRYWAGRLQLILNCSINMNAKEGRSRLPFTAFYEVIGAVNFVGTVAEGWPDREILDPLQVEAFSAQLPALLSAQTDEVVICPDPLIKYFIGGVGPITVQLPSQSFDPVLRFEDGDLEMDGRPLTFGHYLRDVSLNRGGIGPTAGYNNDTPTRLLRPSSPKD